MIHGLRRLLALVKARRLERELEGEVIAHLKLAERDAVAAGLSPEEARLRRAPQFREYRIDEGIPPR